MRYPFEVITEFEVKSLENGVLQLEGYAATFGNVDLHGDVIDERAFDETIERYMHVPVVLAFHDQRIPIGSVHEAHIDKKGLYVVTQVPEAKQQAVKEVRDRILSGELRSFSIGGYFHRKPMGNVNLIHQVDLVEISVVKHPANPWASFTLSGSMQKSLEHKSLFPEYETKELTKLQAKSAFREEETRMPSGPIPFHVKVEGARTPQFLGYWFGADAPGFKQYEFHMEVPDAQTAEQTMQRLRDYSDRAGVTVMVNTPFDWKEVR
ncbi:HK97 family phage prohead protease [Laceyella putida]|uniref:HK97 family phage prohead protease n=1 Tax=Laceyella putida TaxID=110101 RepID=A0ABW2RR00_9BACL